MATTMGKPVLNSSVRFGVDWQSVTPAAAAKVPLVVADIDGNPHTVKDGRGNTPLHLAAAYSKNSDVIAALAKPGVKSEENDEGESPMMLAVRHNNVSAAGALMQCGEKIGIHWAARHVKFSSMAYVIATHAGDIGDVYWDEEQKWCTPLQYAVLINNTAAARGFVMASPKNKRDVFESIYKKNILHFAALKGASRGMMRALSGAGVDAHHRDGKGRTPLDYVLDDEKRRELANELIKDGWSSVKRGIAFGVYWETATAGDMAKVSDGDYCHPFGRPINWAAYLCPNPDVIDALVASGANAFTNGGLEDPPIHYAASGNPNPNVMRAFINAGVSIDADEYHRWTSLHKAVDSENLNVVNFLINAGANLNAVNAQGETPLHLALRGPYYSPQLGVITALVEGGADVNVVTWIRVTPLDLTDNLIEEAKEEDSPYSVEALSEIRKVLVEAGAVHAADVTQEKPNS